MFLTDLPCQNWYEAFCGPPWVEIILLAFKSQQSESSERRAVVLPVPLSCAASLPLISIVSIIAIMLKNAKKKNRRLSISKNDTESL